MTAVGYCELCRCPLRPLPSGDYLAARVTRVAGRMVPHRVWCPVFRQAREPVAS